MPNPRQRYLYPKTSTLDLIKSEGFDYDTPSPLSQAVSRRLVEKEQAEAKAKDMKLSPLDRAVAGLEAVAMAGSAMFESIQQLPQLLKGEDAYSQAIGKRMYQPRYQPEKAAEYVGSAMDALDTLQTEYKLPSIMPELAGFQPLMAAANKQAMQGVKRGALQAGMGLERSLAQPVTDIMNRGGFGAEMLGSFNTPPAQVIKPKGGNWRTSNLTGSFDKSLESLKTQDRQVSPSIIESLRQEANDPLLLDESRARIQGALNEHDAENAVNQWIERNVGNYIKKEMATPEDPVRLMLEKRTQEIESQFQVDMNRAQRTLARAEAETDPRRQANMIRQAEREAEQAKFDKDFAMEYATHLPPTERGLRFESDSEILDQVKEKRQQAGFAPEGMAVSEPAKRWESISDEAIDIKRAGDIQDQKQLMIDAQMADRALAEKNYEISQKFDEWLKSKGEILTEVEQESLRTRTPPHEKASIIKDSEYEAIRENANNAMSKVRSAEWHAGDQNPFISKLDPETSIYSAYIGDLGIDHVVDVIKQDVAAGRIRPEQLNKLSMDQAIKRTAEFNMEQAKKMQETAIKNMEGFPTYKEYPEEGYKWIELAPKEVKSLEDLDDLGLQAYYDYMRSSNNEAYALKAGQKADAEKYLADALKYEGDTMGHCVGGYCPDVIEGRSRIYSLRDQRGEPHVTVEVNPSQHLDYNDWYGKQPTSFKALINAKKTDPSYNMYEEPAYLAAREAQPPIIRQIKGKQNAAPKADYLPYVQDFVRSGQWSEVGDLTNAGLYNINKDFLGGLADFMPQAEDIRHLNKQQRMQAFANAMDAGDLQPGYANRSEWEEALRKHGRPTTGEADDELLRQLQPPPVEGMKAGGAVNISDNPDTMMMELEDQKFAVGGAAIKRVLGIKNHAERALQAEKLLDKMLTRGQLDSEALRLLIKAQTGARALPEVIPRARPKTKDEIRGYAQLTADQLNAIDQRKFLRASPEKSENFTGKSFDQWKMEQDLQHDIRPTGAELQTPKVADIAKQKDMLKLGISGDTSIADKMLYRAGDYELSEPVEQQGGPFYGLRKRAKPTSWASNEKVLAGQQKDVNAFSEAYGGVPVIGQYNAMGPSGSNFAQHFAAANLNAIDITKMSPAQLDDFNELIRRGSPKSGVHHDFPGIEDPSAYTYLQYYPELRKHFNSQMVKPTITEKYGLPDGRVILHAITEPELRDMPVLTSGHSQFELVTGHDPKALPLSEHSTYSHDLPMRPDTPVMQTPFPIPAEFEFSDVKEFVEPLYSPSDMTRVYQTSSPRQIIDQQHIDEVKQYEDFMRQYSPQSERKATGGLIKVKKKAGGVVQKPEQMEASVEAEEPFVVPPNFNKYARGGEINANDLILTERPL